MDLFSRKRLHELKTVSVYCDGSYRPETKIGGWSVRYTTRPVGGQLPKMVAERCGWEVDAKSSHQMEIEAVCQAFQGLREACFLYPEVWTHSDVRAVATQLERHERGVPLQSRGRMYLGLKEELKFWLVGQVHSRWVGSDSGNVHHNAADDVAKAMSALDDNCGVRFRLLDLPPPFDSHDSIPSDELARNGSWRCRLMRSGAVWRSGLILGPFVIYPPAWNRKPER